MSATGTRVTAGRTLSDHARPRSVHDGFVAAAPWYDRLTRLFSFGLDGWWRRVCLDRCELGRGQALLDVATGTGELVIRARRTLGPDGLAVGLDFCREMLGEGRQKVARDGGAGVAWIQGRAEALPFQSESFDRVTVGFALRHVELDDALREIARVLKPGGRFGVLEWTRPDRPFARLVFLGYMRRVVPPFVRLISRDQRVADLAKYLPDSIESFMSGEALSRRMLAAGLTPAGRREYMLGLASICVGARRDPRGTARDEPEAGVRELSGTGRERPRQKWWVILIGGVVLAIVAFQMIFALADMLSR